MSADTVHRAASAPGPPATAPPRRARAELAAYALLVAIALGLRLLDLGDRPFHHDESQDAYFSWVFLTRGDYEYDPLLHGPLRFYLTAGIYAVLGDGDFTARLAPALMGTAMVALPYGLRGQLGRAGAFAAAVALAVGPTYLYFGRFAREDIYFACLALALLVTVFRFLERPRHGHPALIGVLLALSFATKETTFITLFVAGTFVLALLASRWRQALLGPLRAVGADAWGWGVAAFVTVFTVLFTTFLTHPGGLWDGIYTGLAYWLGQHEVGRGGESWFFYAVLLAGHEWPALLLGAIGAGVALRRPTLLRVFLIWAFLLSLAVYSWAGEKFAWLALHPLLPLLLLAGVGVQAIWGARRRWYGIAGLGLCALGLAYAAAASWSVNAERRTDPSELLVTTQSSEAVARVAQRLTGAAAAARREQRGFRIIVDAADGATFPWAWYFRDLDVLYADYAQAGTPPPADALILTERAHARVRDRLPDYTATRFPFRVWWVRDYGALTPATWSAWLLRREPWSPTGGMAEWLYVRR